MHMGTQGLRLARTALAGALVIGVPFAPHALAQTSGQHWVATWAASPQPRAGGPPRAAAAPAAPAPAPANTAQLTSFHNQTIRMVVPTSIGGSRVRVGFSNAYGTGPLLIGGAHVAVHAGQGAILPKTDRELKFCGQASFSVPPGALAISDPVDLTVPKLGELAVASFPTIPGR